MNHKIAFILSIFLTLNSLVNVYAQNIDGEVINDGIQDDEYVSIGFMENSQKIYGEGFLYKDYSGLKPELNIFVKAFDGAFIENEIWTGVEFNVKIQKNKETTEIKIQQADFDIFNAVKDGQGRIIAWEGSILESKISELRGNTSGNENFTFINIVSITVHSNFGVSDKDLLYNTVKSIQPDITYSGYDNSDISGQTGKASSDNFTDPIFGDPSHGGGTGGPGGSGIPIDGGLGFLLAAGVGYGVYKRRN